jgi:Ca2+-binding RTX toxin-like protein
LRPLKTFAALTVTCLLLMAPTAAAQLDTVTVTGRSASVVPPIDTPFGPVSIFGIDIDAHSGASGEDPGGTAVFTFGVAVLGGGLEFSGPVTCLSVTGPGQGGGTPTAPTRALLLFEDSPLGGPVAVRIVDNGGNGADTISFAQGATPRPDCSLASADTFSGIGTLTFGRAVVFDAPPLPPCFGVASTGGPTASNDVIVGTEAGDTIDSLAGNDRICSLAGSDSLTGNAGHDQIKAGSGADAAFGGGRNDRVSGGRDDDDVRGQGGNDVLEGNKGDDDVSGAAGSDQLSGNDGEDHLVGGPGHDICDGGPGTDTAQQCEVLIAIP